MLFGKDNFKKRDFVDEMNIGMGEHLGDSML